MLILCSNKRRKRIKMGNRTNKQQQQQREQHKLVQARWQYENVTHYQTRKWSMGAHAHIHIHIHAAMHIWVDRQRQAEWASHCHTHTHTRQAIDHPWRNDELKATREERAHVCGWLTECVWVCCEKAFENEFTIGPEGERYAEMINEMCMYSRACVCLYVCETWTCALKWEHRCQNNNKRTTVIINGTPIKHGCSIVCTALQMLNG